MQPNKSKDTKQRAFFNGPPKGHFMNEQHELSTIIEKELLTSQRIGSNDGGQAFVSNDQTKMLMMPS